MAERILEGEIVGLRLDDWRAYEGVRTRRVFAFLIDYMIVALLCIPFAILIAILGVITLGLGWALFGVIGPLVAVIYVWNTLGGRNQATVGMRMMGIRLERLDGRPVDGLIAVVHTVLFWAGNVLLTPLVLLASLLLDRKRTVHDLLLGTVVTRSDF
ncbi:RDD family protein [Aquibium sp. LZ166]|uniref:RDD family protein n=1 Tax=Aquibium pacificus TaxID=3153579 RepID=A0ABV3SFS7_9HYPH